MSLNRALGELFRAVREEAARNPDFAERLGQAIAIYKPPRRRKPAPAPALPAAPAAPFDLSASLARADAPEQDVEVAAEPAPALNPIAFLDREGAEALRGELGEAAYSLAALHALIAEHNLDPAGQAAGADRDALIDQIVSQAQKRVTRDKALFNY
jgi:hypothetical protein